MMALTFISPLVASVLYVIVFQKAGFRGAMLFLAAGPVLGAVLTRVLLASPVRDGAPMAGVFLVSAALSLAPLCVLAFAPWPPAGGSGPGGRT